MFAQLACLKAQKKGVLLLLSAVGVLTALVKPGPVSAGENPGLLPPEWIVKESLVLSQRGDQADVYFPSPPLDLRPAYDDAFEVVAVLQGGQVDKQFYEEFGRQLARYGFVVVIPNHFQQVGPPGTPPILLPDQFVVLDVLAQMQVEDADPQSPLYRIADTDHGGVVGHSVGGVVGLFVLEGSCNPPFCFGFFPRPPAVRGGAFYGTTTCSPLGALTDPRCATPANPGGGLINVNIADLPVALVQGSRDGRATPSQALATFDILEAPKVFIPITGANHYGMCDENNPLGATPDPVNPTITQTESIQAVVRAIGRFFRLQVDDDIAVDNQSQAVAKTARLTWSHTIGEGANRLLVVGTSHRDGNKQVTSVTYAGKALRRLAAQNSPGNQSRAEVWYLLAPPPGTADVVVTLSDARTLVGGAVSLTRVDQTAPFRTVASAQGQSATAALSIAGKAAERVVAVAVANGDAKSLAADEGQTEHWNTGTGTAGGDIRGAGSTAPGLPLSTMAYTLGVKKPWSVVVATVQPVATP